MKGGAAESRVRKFSGKKRRFQRLKQGQTDRKKKRGCLCLGVTFSAGAGLRNNGGKDGGMKGQRGGGQPKGR